MAQLAFPRQVNMQLALAPAVMSLEDFGLLRFGHHITALSGQTRLGCPSGTTVWLAGDARGQCVAISFDWTVLAPGTVCVADPLGIASNAWLVDTDGGAVSDGERLRAFVGTVYEMDWETRVQEHIPHRPCRSQKLSQ